MQGAPCVPDSHPYRITSTKCRINTVISPDDGRIVVRNILRKEINIVRKIVHHVGFIYKALHLLYPENEGTTILRAVDK